MMTDQMMIGDLFTHFDNKIPCLRHIDVIRSGNSKKPIGENNSLTPGQIMMNRGNKNLNTFSFYIKHIKDLFCIDFDTKKLNHCDLYNYLNNNNVGFVETVKGFHYYIYIKNIGDFTNEIKILNQDIDMDLIGNGRNVWETKDREYNGDINNIKSFEWSEVKEFFNIQKMNFNNIIQEGEPIEIAKCSKDELIKHIDSTKIIDRISNYDDWLTLGMICYNNFDGSNEGLEIWNKYSKEDDKYEGKKTVIEKYNTFNDTRERLMSYKRLIKWNAIDYPCKNEYERHYKTGSLIEYMNDKHAFFRPTGEFFTFSASGSILRQKSEAFKTDMLNRCFKIIDTNEKEQEINPYKIWVTNIDRRDIEELIFDPSGKCSDGQFNIWKGLDYLNTGDCDINQVQHVLDHIRNIWADGDEKKYNYLIGWFAKILQTPWDKNGICIVLKSIPGVGKTSIIDLFNKIIGSKYSISLSNMKLILGDFNGDAEGKLLVNLNETGMWYDKKMSGAFKEFITDAKITINEKNIKSYTIDNYANCIITTNEDHIVGVSAKDRRFNIIECSDKLYDDEYYEKLRDTNIQELANYFYNVDISNYNPRKYEKSKLFEEQQQLSFNSVELFVKDMIEGDVYSPWYDEDAVIDWEDKTELYTLYTQNCQGSHTNVFNSTHFWIKVNKILPVKYRRPNKGNRQYFLSDYETSKNSWDSYLNR